jgi:3-deoxy-manno-octulosonate cytidylyltransferase (CMP-KDO synthetase)
MKAVGWFGAEYEKAHGSADFWKAKCEGLTDQIFIPVRLGSSRLPNKPLIDICGKTVIQRAIEQCPKPPIVICPRDDAPALVKGIAKGVLYHLVTTAEEDEKYCHCGLDRIARAVWRYPNMMEGVDYGVDFQGDNIHVPKETWDKLALLGVPREISLGTLYQLHDVGQKQKRGVWAVRGAGCSLVFFTRQWLPYSYRHCGIYTFTWESLRHFHWLLPSELEKAEGLEQLRFIHNGEPVFGLGVSGDWIDINTIDDVNEARKLFCKEVSE